MKVMRAGPASIVLVVGLAIPTGARAAEEEATCAEQYLECINDASQVDGFWARTYAEQKCNAGWYTCVRRQAVGM